MTADVEQPLDSENYIISVDVDVPNSQLLEKQANLLMKSDPVHVLERQTASWLAKGILVIFGAVSIVMIIGLFVGWFIDRAGTDTLELAKTILPYLATPLGVALGYYFTRQ